MSVGDVLLTDYSQKTNTHLQLEGYGGLEKCKHLIIPHFPKKIDLFIEPFAGLGRITELVDAHTYRLNDMSNFAVETLRKKFPMSEGESMDFHVGLETRTYTVEQMDFADFIRKYDRAGAFIFCDPPWRKNIYKNNDGVSGRYKVEGMRTKEQVAGAQRSKYKGKASPAFTKDSIGEYYKELLEILPKCKADWMITSDRAETENGKRLQKSGYVNRTEVAPDGCQRFFGRLPAVRLCANYFTEVPID